ncbi:hypothetical protein Y032_0063g3466 [Ancylostoma ceylanicum]|uniref:Uncharacterized protein n=1 Tax=Ancylostoma ceylanicum TaxID=53326 RepID=A0A016U1Z3_9BILA|nr:hypothetical protein Y032_0063g3466 [Ancylostoma ceylanicum]
MFTTQIFSIYSSCSCVCIQLCCVYSTALRFVPLSALPIRFASSVLFSIPLPFSSNPVVFNAACLSYLCQDRTYK